VANLLQIPADWDATSAQYNGGVWEVAVNGVYAEVPNGSIRYIGTVQPGDTIQATVTYEITEAIDQDLWFLVYSSSGAIIAHKMWNADHSSPTTGQFDVDVDMTDWPWVILGASTSSEEFVDPLSYGKVAEVFISPPIAPPEPPPPDHHVLICYSKDGGRNWSNWKKRSLGDIGQYADRIRVRLTRLGVGRQWVFRVRVSSPIKRDLLGAVAKTEPRS
jgi:hypothetical protein